MYCNALGCIAEKKAMGLYCKMGVVGLELYCNTVIVSQAGAGLRRRRAASARRRGARGTAGARQGCPAGGAQARGARSAGRSGARETGRRGARAAWARAAWAQGLARAVHSMHSACFRSGLTQYCS